jgi:two-component system, NtrC family, response regulator HydG
MPALLTIESGQGDPRVCELLPGAAVKLGRHQENQMILRDEHASRFHAEVFEQNGCWMIRDVGGRNGTRVNGQIISGPTALDNGSRITIGKTTLRFAEGVGAAPAPIYPQGATRLLHMPEAKDLTETAFQPDEFTALFQFMTAQAKETDPEVLIRSSLEIIHQQTAASATGFLSLDPENPWPRMVFPAGECVDVQLSRQLTQSVQRQGQAVWLAAQPNADLESESLTTYADALCIPLQAGETPVGALHVYKATVFFTEREVRFCEIIARQLANSLHILRFRRSLEAENLRLRRHLAAADELIGESTVMQQLRQRGRLLAACPSPVLIVGESGVGKELVALAVHRASSRREGPLVTVNCAAITAELADSELFGHRRGAFTGAESDYPGLFQQADAGTLFLDEVGELAPEIQAKLLRVVEGKKVRAVGSTTELQVDVRIIAATNRDLEREIEAGRFRRDLFFRLQGVQIVVPPLRDHREDIPDLVHHFVAKMREEWGRRINVTEAAIRLLMEYPWPGNVRQLRFVLESAVALQQKDTVDTADLSFPPGPAAPLPAGVPSLNLDELETWAIRHALAHTNNNMSQASRVLGIVRDTLAKKMRKYGIDKDSP